MKKIIFIIAILVFGGCKEETPTNNNLNQNEEILEVSHRFYRGGCLGYCDTKLVIDSNQIYYKLEGWNVDESGIYEVLETKDSTYKIQKEKWYKITNFIDMDSIMVLDSLYIIDSTNASEGHFEIQIISNERTKNIKFLNTIEIPSLKELNEYLTKMRDSL